MQTCGAVLKKLNNFEIIKQNKKLTQALTTTNLEGLVAGLTLFQCWTALCTKTATRKNHTLIHPRVSNDINKSGHWI